MKQLSFVTVSFQSLIAPRRIVREHQHLTLDQCNVPKSYWHLMTIHKRIFSLYTCCMVLTSALPMSNSTETTMFWSKMNPSVQNLLHVPMFIGFSYLLGRAIKMKLILIFALAITMGVLLEGIQIYVPGRYPGVSDLLLNTIGAILGIFLLGFINHRRIQV